MVPGPVALRIAACGCSRMGVGWVVGMPFFSRCWWAGGLATGAVVLAAWSFAPRTAHGETLETALVQAYQNNPSLNSQRAAVRATDENVSQALSGYRPRVSIVGTGGQQSVSSTTKNPSQLSSTAPITCSKTSCPPFYDPAYYTTQSGYNTPASVGATITQTLFNGFQTANKTRQAEAQVLSARATLRVTEQ